MVWNIHKRFGESWLGCSIWEVYQASDQTMRISKAIIDIVKAILSSSKIEAVERVLESLQSQGNEPWWVVFDCKSMGHSQNGNFQVAPCSKDFSGQVVMALGSFYLTASAREDRWIWFDYSSTNINLFKATQVSTFKEDVYSQVHQAVIDKLRNNATTFIGGLDIWNLKEVTDGLV